MHTCTQGHPYVMHCNWTLDASAFMPGTKALYTRFAWWYTHRDTVHMRRRRLWTNLLFWCYRLSTSPAYGASAASAASTHANSPGGYAGSLHDCWQHNSQQQAGSQYAYSPRHGQYPQSQTYGMFGGRGGHQSAVHPHQQYAVTKHM